MPLPRSAVRIWNREVQLDLDSVLAPFPDSVFECFQTTISNAIIEYIPSCLDAAVNPQGHFQG